jgi:hypothetical protein
VLENIGIDFSADYHTLNNEQKALLIVWAKITKYRKPNTAGSSLSHCFFKHLQKVKIKIKNKRQFRNC